MVATEQETVELLMQLFEDNIEDPLNRHKKWIYDDIPRHDIGGFPRIAVTPADSTYEQLGIGNTSQEEDQTIIVEVFVRKDSKITTSNYSRGRAEQVGSDIMKEVKDVIKSNRQHFIDNGLLCVIPQSYNKSIVNNLLIFRLTLLAKAVN